MSYNGAGTLRPGINAFRNITPFHFILLNNQEANRKSTNCFLCLLVNENAFHLCILSLNVKRSAVFLFRPDTSSLSFPPQEWKVTGLNPEDCTHSYLLMGTVLSTKRVVEIGYFRR